jgi:hypothetical protein
MCKYLAEIKLFYKLKYYISSEPSSTFRTGCIIRPYTPYYEPIKRPNMLCFGSRYSGTRSYKMTRQVSEATPIFWTTINYYQMHKEYAHKCNRFDTYKETYKNMHRSVIDLTSTRDLGITCSIV